jgi:hypothetical protein
MRVFIVLVLLAMTLVAGCASTGQALRRHQPEDSYVLARFAAVVCDDLLSDHEGSLHRYDHLDSSGRVRIVLSASLHEQFRKSIDDLDVDPSRIVLFTEGQIRNSDSLEAYLSFSLEKNEWAVWYKCLSLAHREPKDGSRTTGVYSESWWVSNGGIGFSYCFADVQ